MMVKIIKLPEFIRAVQTQIGADKILTDPADCWPYGGDSSRRHELPDVVVMAEQHSDVLTTLKLCNEFKIPVVPRGRGTGTPGGAIPLQAGVVLSLEKMDRIISIDPDNRAAKVEPGVLNEPLQHALAPHHFFWPPDPSSSAYCSIGGNLAYNSAGPRAVKYGTPRENTLGLRAVTGSGEEIRTGIYTTKGAVGYDLTRLLIGSEGTLAVITEATLKLTPLPSAKINLRATYQSIDDAARAVAAIMAQPVTPCALEIMDHACLNIIRANSTLAIPAEAQALLIIEVDGHPNQLADAVAAIKQAARNNGMLDILNATNPNEEQAIWQLRKTLSPSLRAIAPNKVSEDVVVPVSRLPELINESIMIGKRHNIQIVNYGHAGNGNIHVNLLVDKTDQKQLPMINACLEQLFDLVIRLDGTISGEHGVGIEKRAYIHKAIDPVTLSLMQRIKQQFDPLNILNPGKIFPQN